MKLEIEFDSIGDLSDKLVKLLVELHPTSEKTWREFAMQRDERPISVLELGVRAENCLKGDGIRTIGQLMARRNSLMKVPNLGIKSAQEVDSALDLLLASA